MTNQLNPDFVDAAIRAAMDQGGGLLNAALAKAQSEFPAIAREKEVTVTTKSGGSYKFKYAPLDAILNAVRKPLTDNGLAITQLLDGGDLVTMLLHKDGGSLVGRLPIPDVDGVQAFGSAITYLRRYSIQAILGIAAEEDDDGNTAAGNTATFGGKPAAKPEPVLDNGDGSLIGVVELAKDSPDFLPHTGPEGPVLSFKLVGPSGGIKVIATGGLAEVLATQKDAVIGERVSCWGRVRDETFRPKGAKRDVTYQVLDLERIKTPTFTLPAPLDDVELPEPPDTVELFGEGEL